MEFLVLSYHYIDNPKKYASGIYPISPTVFNKQLDIISKEYKFISENDLVDSIKGKRKMEKKECLISFDDGLKCQFTNAIPVLREKGIPAVLFLSTQPYTENKANMVHKIHYLLSKVSPEVLIEDLKKEYLSCVGKPLRWDLVDIEKITKWYIYDKKTPAIFKYLLNHMFSPELSILITGRIFEKYYKRDEKAFCDDLYIQKKHIESIKQDPLFSIGLHSHSHLDISKFPVGEVIRDFKKNKKVLEERFSIKDIRGLSYPYGISDNNSDKTNRVDAIRSAINPVYGVTTKKGVNRSIKEPLLLKRFNPNDLSKLQT